MSERIARTPTKFGFSGGMTKSNKENVETVSNVKKTMLRTPTKYELPKDLDQVNPFTRSRQLKRTPQKASTPSRARSAPSRTTPLKQVPEASTSLKRTPAKKTPGKGTVTPAKTSAATNSTGLTRTPVSARRTTPARAAKNLANRKTSPVPAAAAPAPATAAAAAPADMFAQTPARATGRSSTTARTPSIVGVMAGDTATTPASLNRRRLSQSAKKPAKTAEKKKSASSQTSAAVSSKRSTTTTAAAAAASAKRQPVTARKASTAKKSTSSSRGPQTASKPARVGQRYPLRSSAKTVKQSRTGSAAAATARKMSTPVKYSLNLDDETLDLSAVVPFVNRKQLQRTPPKQPNDGPTAAPAPSTRSSKIQSSTKTKDHTAAATATCKTTAAGASAALSMVDEAELAAFAPKPKLARDRVLPSQTSTAVATTATTTATTNKATPNKATPNKSNSPNSTAQPVPSWSG
mmetsp:Transcript_33956/g.66868  ORF Transcript_33956/g.66868 Transcript_33956/m.66868 type:complete len:464 (+) Transcript_33956:51-1442(+)